MNDQEIINAITKAKPGIAKYLSIMEHLYTVDVSTNLTFQTQYNAFYRVRQRQLPWYQSYFQIMQDYKGKSPSFDQILTELQTRIGNNTYEPSFASKLVATLNPWMPVWDTHILRNTGHNPPSYSSRTKHVDAILAYASIVTWFNSFMTSTNCRAWITLFNDNVNGYYKITDIKKIDFILWQTRKS